MPRLILTFDPPAAGTGPDSMSVESTVMHSTHGGYKLGSDLKVGDHFYYGGAWLAIATTAPEA